MSPPLGAFGLVGRAVGGGGPPPPDPYDPTEHDWTVLLLPGQYTADAGGGDWLGTASTGTSGAADFDGGAGTSPAVASGVGGADFDGVDDHLEGVGITMADVVGATAAAWTILVVLEADYAEADPGPGLRYLAPCFIVDVGLGYLSGAHTDSGISIEAADGIGSASTLTVACPVGGRKLGLLQYDGADLRLRVIGASDSGWQTEAYLPLGSTAGTPRIGGNYDATAFLDGRLRAWLAAARVVDDTEIDDLVAWVVANIGALS